MNFIVIGCGRVGAQLAYNLFKQGHKVAIVDNNGASFTNLPTDFYGRTIEGEATHLDILKRAGIENADGLAVVTNSDSLNAVIGEVAKNYFNLDKVVVRNYDPFWRSMIDSFQLDVVSSSSWGANRIQEILINPDVQFIAGIEDGEVGIYEIKVPQEIDNLPLSNILIERDCVIVGLVRKRNVVHPEMDTRLKTGDTILISTKKESLPALQQHLASLKEKPA